MVRLPVVLPLVFAVLLLMSVPVTATVVQSAVSFSPNPPLAAGGQQKVTATYVVIPSGATTFSPNHDLQMQTGLSNAQWVIQVIVDGHNAARQTASGSVAFLNGALLSYSTTQDVSFTVTITGTVPAGAGPQVMVLQVVELDNAGTVVPGSTLTLTQPVAGQLPDTPATTQLPVRTPEVPPSSQATPQTPLPAVCVVLAAGMGALLMARLRNP
ncbi:hypothetical protein [Methanoregula sp.]|uniref:hypothetical protein n=1 Tax=Methanoregula sp. TaxID=2052170 RepID=UPI003569CE63